MLLGVETLLMIGLVCVLIFHIFNLLFELDIEIILLFSSIMSIFLIFNIFAVIQTNNEDISFSVKFMNTLFYYGVFLVVHVGILYLVNRWREYRAKY